MIKSFLETDDESSVSTGTRDVPSIFGGLDPVPENAPANDTDDPFAASDFHIEQPLTLVSQPEPQRTELHSAVQNEPFTYTPPTAAESSRMWGLAFTAGIAFVSSVVFMLLLGWLVDTFIGTAPWGIVGGIVLGSIIGFIQFFRLNSQILNSSKPSKPTSFLDLGERKPVDDKPDETAAAEPEEKTPENPSAPL